MRKIRFKRVAGGLCIGAPVAILFGLAVADVGLVEALMSLGFVIALVGLFFVGFKLLDSGRAR